MALRARYFPGVVLFGCILLLVVPFYYMDHWVSFSFSRPIISPSPPTASPAEKLSTATMRINDIHFPRSDINEISKQDDDDEDQRMVKNAKRMRMINRYRFQQGFNRIGQAGDEGGSGGGGGSALRPNVPFSIQRLNPRAGEFALQMARDRLRIERYAMMIQNSDGNYTGDWDRWMKESSTDNTTDKLQVMVMSYFRGGTTFFGDLLNQHPGTFYHFEPLHGVSGNDQVQEEGDIAASISLLRHLLRCEYESTNAYIDWVRNEMKHRFLFEHNKRLWLSCQFQLPLCFEPKFLRSMCELHPIHVFKVVRLRLNHARRLLDEFPKLKMIYLARDPRGLYSSRRDLEWCSTTRSCIDPDVYCYDMQKDLATAVALKIKYPDRFLALRYEDLALDTENQMKKVLQFLELSYNRTHKHLGKFIESHTKFRYQGAVDEGPYSIRRDSRKTAFSWRKKLSPHEVSYVESACKNVIKQLALP